MDFSFDKVRPFSALTLFHYACFMSSGILFLFVFDESRFLDLDLFRLSLMSIAITAPILAVNTFIIHTLISPNRSTITEDKFHMILGGSAYIGTLLSFFALYTTVLVGYFYQWSMRSGVRALLIIQIIIAILFFIIGQVLKRQRLKANANNESVTNSTSK